MRNFYCLVLIFLSVHFAHARQNPGKIVEGQVVDERLRPYENVTVMLKNITGVRPVYTDKSGHFLMEIPPGIEITDSSKFIVDDAEVKSGWFSYNAAHRFIQIRRSRDAIRKKQRFTGQVFSIKVTNERKEGIPYAPVDIHNTRFYTNSKGEFSLKLDVPPVTDRLYFTRTDKVIIDEKVENKNNVDMDELAVDVYKQREARLRDMIQKSQEGSLTDAQKDSIFQILTTEKLLTEELLTALSVADDRAISDSLILSQTQEEKEKIALAKQELEEKRQKEQEEFRLKLYIAFGFILLFAAFGWFMFRSRRKIVAQKEVIEKANVEIQEKHRLLEVQTKQLEQQKGKLQEQNSRLDKQKSQLESQKVVLEEQKVVLEDQKEAMIAKNEELEKTYNALKDTQGQLVQSEKMASLGVLTAGMAHEINNPLNFISAGVDGLRTTLADLKEVSDKYLTALEEKVTEYEPETEILAIREDGEYDELMDDASEWVVDINAGAVRTLEIVNGLKTFSRLDEGSMKNADLHENLDSTIILLRTEYKDRIEIIKNYGDIPQVDCYISSLNQVFMNLLANASQAIETTGTVTVSTDSFTENEENFVRVRVRDTGMGIPEENRERVFEPFFTTKEVGKGTGMGLAITYGIVKNHNATLTFESETGVGTEFILTLPVRQD